MIEARAKGVDLGFLQLPAGGLLGGAALDMARLDDLAQLPHVAHVYPKREVALPLGAQGGSQLFGRALYTDLFVTALPEAAVQDANCRGFIDAAPNVERLADDAVIPLVIAPGLIALYNASVAPSLNTPTLQAEHLIGFSFDLVVGRSMMLGERGARIKGTQRATIVGVSPLAAPLGGTIPWRYAQLLWAKYAPEGKVSAPVALSSIIVQAQGPQDIVSVTDSILAAGLQVDAQAQQVRHVLWGAMWLLATSGLLVLALAASQTAVNLSAYVREKRQQWALLQAIGLTRRGLVGLIVAQASALGALGAGLGLVLAYGASLSADAMLHRVWPNGVISPSTLFLFPPKLVCGCVVAAVVASVGGALGPAISAARRPVHAGLRD
jgi:hypothetical protein